MAKKQKKFTFDEALADLEDEYRTDGSDVDEIISAYELRMYALKEGDEDEDEDEAEELVFEDDDEDKGD